VLNIVGKKKKKKIPQKIFKKKKEYYNSGLEITGNTEIGT
jgi:hypothetical protein